MEVLRLRSESMTEPRAARRALGSMMGILFLTFLDTTIMTIALADIQATLHAGVTALQWILNSYALLFAALMLAFGTLGDRLGRKRMMLAGVVVFGAGSLFGALAPNTSCVIAARAVMGVGAAACEPGTLSIIRHIYPERRSRARAIGVWAAIAGLALALGPVIGGLLAGAGGWRAIFWFNLAAAAAAFVAAYRFVPESADPTKEKVRFDYGGFTLGPAGLAMIVFAIIVGETRGYGDPLVLALFAAGGAALILFGFIEHHSRAPMLDVDYLRKPAFSGSLAVAFCAYFGVFSIFFLTALYLQTVVGYSSYRTAALFGPMAVLMIGASALSGLWVARSGPRLPVAVGSVAAGAGVLLTDMALAGDIEFVWLALSLALAGLGFGIAIVPTTTVAMGAVPPQFSGMAASATTTSREAGTVIGVATLGAMFNAKMTNELTRRLAELDIPEDAQKIVIDAVKTGMVPKGGTGAAGAEQQYGDIVSQVINAAYNAVHTGVSISLAVAGVVILVSGLLAMATFGRSASATGVDDL